MMPDITAGQALGRYTIGDVISRGGTATVYRAHVTDQPDLPPVAIKVVDLGEGYEEAYNEAELLMSLSHPGLPRVFEAFEEEDRLVVVEDLVEGQTLDAYVQENGPLAQADVIANGLALASILSYLHERPRKVIHRDLKPGNIILSEHGLVLVDFGIAKVLQPGKDYDTVYAYTQRYASPEQLLNRGTDERSDIYSFGATLAFLATGVPTPPAIGAPPTGSHTITVKDVSPERLHSAVTPELRSLILKCMEFDPDKRYQDFRSLVRALRRVQRGLTPDAWRPAGWMIAVAGVALTAALLGGWWYQYGLPGGVPGKQPIPSRVPTIDATERAPLGSPLKAELVWDVTPPDAAKVSWIVKDVVDGNRAVGYGSGPSVTYTPSVPGTYLFEATYGDKSYTVPSIVYADFILAATTLKDTFVHLSANGTVSERAAISYTWRIQRPTGTEDRINTTAPRAAYKLTENGVYRISLITNITADGQVTKAESDLRPTEVYDIPIPDSAQAVNLNPSFESTDVGGLPVVWSILSPDTRLDTALAFRGQFSLYSSGSTKDAHIKAMEQVLVERGTKYRAQVWVRGYKASGSAPRLEIWFRSRNSDTYVAREVAVSQPLTGTYDWQRLLVEFTTPSKEDATLEVRLVHPGRGSVWFDYCVIQAIR